MSGSLTTETVPARVAETYAAFFANLQILHPLINEYRALPPLGASDFEVIGETDEEWIVTHEPLTGVTVKARVMKSNGLVAFDPVFVATE